PAHRPPRRTNDDLAPARGRRRQREPLRPAVLRLQRRQPPRLLLRRLPPDRTLLLRLQPRAELPAGLAGARGALRRPARRGGRRLRRRLPAPGRALGKPGFRRALRSGLPRRPPRLPPPLRPAHPDRTALAGGRLGLQPGASPPLLTPFLRHHGQRLSRRILVGQPLLPGFRAKIFDQGGALAQGLLPHEGDLHLAGIAREIALP